MTISERIRTLFPEANDIPESYRLMGFVEQREYLIDGKIHLWNGPTQAVLSPVCVKVENKMERQTIGSYPLLTQKEAIAAHDAAVAAYDKGSGRWPTMSVTERIEHVEDFILRMVERRDEIVNLIMWEIAKSLKDARGEFDRTVQYIRDTINALKDLDRTSSRFVIENGIIAQIRRAPLGVVLCMGPYNYPLNETFTTLIPALIMGNTVVFKPPKLGVLLFRPLLEAFRDSFPNGVVNSIFGDGREVVSPIIQTGEVAALAFIGSSKVSNIIRSQHPKPNRLKCVLGLEAKNVGIVLPDSDMELAVRECTLGALGYNGQRCTALKTLFVHQIIADEFVMRLSESINSLKFGMPWDQEGVNLTPLPEPGKCEYLTTLIQDAKEKGAAVVNEHGGTVCETFFFPAVLYPVSQEMRIWHEEQFGPVVPVVRYDNLDEPIRYIRESDYGQQVSIFGTNVEKLSQLIDPLVNQVCRVNLNCQCQRGPDTFPFTGRKDSAEGTLSVSDTLRVFAIRTLVATKDIELNKSIVSAIVRERKSKFLSTDFIL